MILRAVASVNSMFPDGSTADELVNSLMLYEQAVEPAAANPAVQQFVQSVCPNILRSMSVLIETGRHAAGAGFFALEETTVEATTPEVSTTEVTTESLKESLRKPRRRKTEPTRSNKIFQRKMIQW
ncbi:hypothetical protein quinque_013862 [Culex quinquefasciatus]